MGKTLVTYRNYTATELKTRADIPAAADITVNAGDIDCENISLSEVKKLIGETDWSLGHVVVSSSVNLWSNFCPVVRTYSSTGTLNGLLTQTAPTTAFKLGDFAGYNHNAAAPQWNTKSLTEADVWINSGATASIPFDFSIGEIDYSVDGETALGVCVSLWIGTTFHSKEIQALSGFKEDVDSIVATAALTSETTFTGKVHIVDHLTTFATDGSNVICKVPNVTDFTVTVKIKTSSYWKFVPDGGGSHDPPSPFTANGAGSMNWTTGYFDIGEIVATTNQDNLSIVATLYNWLNAVIGSATIFDGDYIADDFIDGSFYLGMTSIPSYGYRVECSFEFGAS